MKQQILDALKAKFEGVSEKILGRVADKLAKTAANADEAKAAAEGVTMQQLLDSYGDSRATEAQQTAIKNYEAKHGLKEGKTANANQEDGNNEPGKDEPGKGEDIPAWAKSLIESNKALGEQMKALQGEKLTATRRGELSKITSALPQSLRKGYARTPIDTHTDEEFETLKTEISAEVDAIVKETSAKGAIFGKPTVKGGTETQRTAGGNKEATEEEVKAVAERMGL